MSTSSSVLLARMGPAASAGIIRPMIPRSPEPERGFVLAVLAQGAQADEELAEVAQLKDSLPRLRGLWQHLERLGGGVGTRGPGETQLESDRRQARRRIALLERRLKRLERQRETRRSERRRSETPTVALAGY